MYELLSLTVEFELTFCCSAMKCNYEGCDIGNVAMYKVERHFISSQLVVTFAGVVHLLTRTFFLQCPRACLLVYAHGAGPAWKGIPMQSRRQMG